MRGVAALRDLGIAGGMVEGAEAEQRLEGRERCLAAVVAENELIEVVLQMSGRDAPGRS